MLRNKINSRSLTGFAGGFLYVVLILAAIMFPSAAHAGSPHVVVAIGASRLLMAGMIVNPENIRGLTTSFKAIFADAFGLAESQYQKVAMEVPSGTKTQTYSWLGMSTRFREWLGDRTIQNLMLHGFSIINKRFENTIGVQRDDILDDQVGVYKPLFQQLGKDAKTHPDELVFDLLKNSFTTKCYDGQYFIDTDHPVLDANGIAQSVSNFGGGAGVPWFLIDTTNPIKPIILQIREQYSFTAMDRDDDENVFKRNEFLYGATGRLNVGVGLWQLIFGSKATLNAANYAAARAAMRNFTADGGKKLNVVPKLLVVPPSLEGAANALLKAQKDAAGADNIWFGTADVIVVPWLE
jgi:phage major head subunit gpT-like protein